MERLRRGGEVDGAGHGTMTWGYLSTGGEPVFVRACALGGEQDDVGLFE